jgi:hypothetical protein
MVSLRQDSKGNFIARKRLPDDVREDYGQLYGARFEAKFFARASVGKQVAQQKFRQWATEVEQRIEAIRKAQRGEGLDLVTVAIDHRLRLARGELIVASRNSPMCPRIEPDNAQNQRREHSDIQHCINHASLH